VCEPTKQEVVEMQAAESFTLEIALGNEAMQTRQDVAGALRNVAYDLEHNPPSREAEGTIRDLNGNTVGTWKLAVSAETAEYENEQYEDARALHDDDRRRRDREEHLNVRAANRDF
jgi:hypothetical protein